jgi:hypothetical protein
VTELGDRVPEERLAVLHDSVELPEQLEADEAVELRPGGDERGDHRGRQVRGQVIGQPPCLGAEFGGQRRKGHTGALVRVPDDADEEQPDAGRRGTVVSGATYPGTGDP